MASPVSADWAYLAGFVDGEGCISSYQHRQGNHLYFIQMVVTQIDPRPLHWARELFQVGDIRVDNRETSRWRVSGHPLVPLLEGMLPYFRVKREEAETAILLMTTNRHKGAVREQRFLHTLLRLNKQERAYNV